MKLLYFIFLMFKRSIKKPSFMPVLILMPIAAAWLCSLGVGEGLKIKAGLFSEGSFDLSHIAAAENEAIDFILYESPTDLERDVASGKLECGYIFSADFPSEYDGARLKNSVVCLKKPRSVFCNIVNEALFAELFGSYAADILKTEGLKYTTADEKKLTETYYNYRENFSAVSVSPEYAKTPQKTDRGLDIFVCMRGIAGIFILMGSLFGGYMRFRDKGALRSFSPVRRHLAGYFYFLVPSFLSAVSAGVSLKLFGGFNMSDFLMLLIYFPTAAAFGLILSDIFHSEELFSAVSALLIIACLIFCPTANDIIALAPEAAVPMAVLIPIYCMRGNLLAAFVTVHIAALIVCVSKELISQHHTS